jgi:ABC-type sugar transport system permease subunit
MGTASAVAFLLFLVMFAATALMWRFGEGRESVA